VPYFYIIDIEILTNKGSEKSSRGPVKIPAREQANRTSVHEMSTVIGYSTMTWE